MKSFPTVTVSILLLIYTAVSPMALGQRKEKPTAEPTRDFEYKAVDGKSLMLHVFEPKVREVNSSQKTAAIVFFFGGGWTNGQASQFYPFCQHLADHGMLAMSADYRVHSRDNALVVDCVADAQDALLYVRQHAGELRVDSKRIAAGGGSAGGHLAAALATLSYRGKQADVKTPDYRPDALVLCNPAAVLAPIEGRPDIESLRAENLKARMGGAPTELSPYHHLSKELPPTLILHGEADTTVPFWTVEAFRDKAQQLGASCKLIGYPGQAHGFFNAGREKYESARDQMTAFLSDIGFCTP